MTQTQDNDPKKNDPIVIIAAKRTPIGSMLGVLRDVPAPRLGARAIKGVLKNADINTSIIDEVYMGCVLPAGLGQAPARQAALYGGLKQSTACTTVSKVCGSGLKAVMLAHDAIKAGSAHVVIAGGMESMSGAPHLIQKIRSGVKMGNTNIYDHMFLDGLQDVYESGTLMGVFAEACATEFNFTRKAQDDFALTSLSRALEAEKSGAFKKEIAPITIMHRGSETEVARDEPPQGAIPEKIPHLKPAFAKDGTVTAANASSISDGAAAVLLMRASQAEMQGLQPLARIVSHASFAKAPNEFTTAPIEAMKRACDKAGWNMNDIDLFEINEAFAVVTMAAMQALKLPHEKVNIHGGACALGHPIGASGARILTTLIHALHTHNLKTGMASLCIGGGEAVALTIERM